MTDPNRHITSSSRDTDLVEGADRAFRQYDEAENSRRPADVADVLRLDFWNEHHYQITSTFDFYVALHRNLVAGNAVGDEASLTSALVHTRSLLEFYRPALQRAHVDAVWWVTGLGYQPADNTDWQRAIGREWAALEPWVQPIHTFLAHISWARRFLELPRPADAHDQRWPLLDMTRRSLRILALYREFVRANTRLGDAVVTVVNDIHGQAQQLWIERQEQALAEGAGYLLE